uniref:Zinc finger PHD-type domain-containing protein n=1 Tax=Octopus bimaculoides TaxID=37653 RepID=A0A0L8IC46_OCTBM
MNRTSLPSSKWLCLLCRKDVGRNSKWCAQCKLWTHKKCSGIIGRLIEKVAFVCRRCMEAINMKDNRETNFFKCPGGPQEVVDSFYYLGNIISSGRGYSESIVARIRIVQRAITSVGNISE